MTDKEARLEALARKYGFRKAEAPAAPAAPAPGPAPEKRNPNRGENELMLNLMVLRNGLIKYSPAIRERCRQAGPTVWRDLRLMATLSRKVQEALLETMPQRRVEYYQAYRERGQYVMQISGPVRTGRQILVSDVHLGAVCDAALRGVCALCISEGKEVDKCPLREGLMEVAPPTQLNAAGSRFAECEYRNAARQLVLGEEPEV